MIVDPRLVVGSTWRVRNYSGGIARVTSITPDTVIYIYIDDSWADDTPIELFLKYWSYVPDMDTELEYL
jgi:hypothetical protein